MASLGLLKMWPGEFHPLIQPCSSTTWLWIPLEIETAKLGTRTGDLPLELDMEWETLLNSFLKSDVSLHFHCRHIFSTISSDVQRCQDGRWQGLLYHSWFFISLQSSDEIDGERTEFSSNISRRVGQIHSAPFTQLHSRHLWCPKIGEPISEISPLNGP